MAVRTKPGLIVTIFIPSLRNSIRADSNNWASAAFDALYVPLRGMPRQSASEPTEAMVPPPDSRRIGTNTSSARAIPKVLTSKVFTTLSDLKSAMVFEILMPELTKTKSTLSNVSLAFRASSCQSSRLVTSQRWAIAFVPISSHRLSKAAKSLEASNNRKPLAAYSLANARPIPALAPTKMRFLSFKFLVVKFNKQ